MHQRIRAYRPPRKLIEIFSERTLNVDTSFQELIENASIDKSSKVRRVAAEFLIQRHEELGSDSLRLANLFVSDKSPAVSERGKFALKRMT